jgi:multicomponent Na+:H+ antiporter subunit D
VGEEVTALPALAPMLPLIVAALLAAGRAAPRRLVDLLAIATAASVTAICLVLLFQSTQHPVVYWFGGWRPLPHGIAIGIAFAIDPIGAGMAVLAGVLVTAALVFSWHYFDSVGSLFHALLLVFLGAMVAFSLTGDLFDIFVFFELMSVAAFILAGYRLEERGPLQGALNFGFTNTVAAFMILWGIALVYGRTGALNMAQIGRALAGQPPDGLVIVAFVLIMLGFFVKAAVFPFHFWIADAHAVAPTPVCIVFSGVMIELGLYAIARIYWTCFSGSLQPDAVALRDVLLVIGSVTALVAAIMCFAQHHLKRLLAFSSMSHVGLFLAGMGLLQPLGLAGAAVYVLGHGVVKAALFLCVGVLLNRFGTVDEIRLRGLGRQVPVIGGLYLLGGFGLAAAPPFGTYLGSELIGRASADLGYGWVLGIAFVSALVVGGAVLRSGSVVFLGLGEAMGGFYSPRLGDEEPEEPARGRAVPAFMLGPIVVLMAAGLLVGLAPGLPAHALQAANAFQDRGLSVAAVLGGGRPQLPPLRPLAAPDAGDLAHGLGSAAGAVLLALVALFRHRLPAPVSLAMRAFLRPPIGALRALQTGNVADYVTWISVGGAVLAVVFGVTLRPAA